MPSLPEEAFFTIAPDWVCEVLSPATTCTDRIIKMPIYAEHGVRWLWLVEPVLRTLEVFHLHEGHWLLEAAWQEDAEVRAPPFADIVIPLAGWWVP